MKHITAALLLGLCGPAMAQTIVVAPSVTNLQNLPRDTNVTVGSWNLVIRTDDGRVRFVHGLAPDECQTEKLHALGQPATDDEKRLLELSDKKEGNGAPTILVYPRSPPLTLGHNSINTSQTVTSAECFQ